MYCIQSDSILSAIWSNIINIMYYLHFMRQNTIIYSLLPVCLDSPVQISLLHNSKLLGISEPDVALCLVSNITVKACRFWWDSNLWLSAYKSGPLPTELKPGFIRRVFTTSIEYGLPCVFVFNRYNCATDKKLIGDPAHAHRVDFFGKLFRYK